MVFTVYKEMIIFPVSEKQIVKIANGTAALCLIKKRWYRICKRSANNIVFEHAICYIGVIHITNLSRKILNKKWHFLSKCLVTCIEYSSLA